MCEYLIWSFEHDAWWRPAQWGYTRELAEAGHYTAREAQQIVAHANIVTMNEEVIPVAQGATYQPPPSIVCPRCRRRSFNLNDVREGYCGACHVFHP